MRVTMIRGLSMWHMMSSASLITSAAAKRASLAAGVPSRRDRMFVPEKSAEGLRCSRCSRSCRTRACSIVSRVMRPAVTMKRAMRMALSCGVILATSCRE